MNLNELYKQAYYKNKSGMILCGDCVQIMRKMDDACIDLTVTSHRMIIFAHTTDIVLILRTWLKSYIESLKMVVLSFGLLEMLLLKVVKLAHHLDKRCILWSADLICTTL